MSVNEGDVIKIASSVLEKLDKRLSRYPYSPPDIVEILGRQFPAMKPAMFKLEPYKVLKVHDDGDLTVVAGGKEYVVTTAGQVFEQKSNTVLD